MDARFVDIEMFAADLEARISIPTGPMPTAVVASFVRDIVRRIRLLAQQDANAISLEERQVACVDLFLEAQAALDAADAATAVCADASTTSSASSSATESVPVDEVPTRVADARARLRADLRAWLDVASPERTGRLLILKTTPGLGKTEEMIREAVRRNRELNERIVFAVRTKSQISGPMPELLQRFGKTDPARRALHLPIYGRDETNCYRIEDVEQAQLHGLSPSHEVCNDCEHNPKNTYESQAASCAYYRRRRTARAMLQAHKRTSNQSPPIILTTHCSLVQGLLADGSEYRDIWNADVIFMDEDPTDALEHDDELSVDDLRLIYNSPSCDVDTRELSGVLISASEAAARERRHAAGVGFRFEGNGGVHSRNDSTYASDDLLRILEQGVATVGAKATLFLLARNVSERCAAEYPDQLEVASAVRRLKRFSDALLRERYLRGQVTQRQVEESNVESLGTDVRAESMRIVDIAYVARLECVPVDPFRYRNADKWQYVVRSSHEFANHSAAIVIGDAYAQREHYSDLFERQVEQVDILAELESGSIFTRVIAASGIGALIANGRGEIYSAVEIDISRTCSPGDRVVMYVHKALRSELERIAKVWKTKYQLAEIAVEHWWGGRGKDSYNGWTHLYGVSDPIPSVRGVEHSVNARVFRQALRGWFSNWRDLQRLRVGSPSAGAVSAFCNSSPRIQVEFERTATAEVTQAIHRLRPVTNRVRVVTFGELERSKELLLQTVTVVPHGCRFDRKASCQRKTQVHRIDVPIAAFVTFRELCAAVRVIAEHFGVWHPFFRHALVVPAGDFSPHPSSVDGRMQTEWHRTLVARVWDPISAWGRLVANELRPALVKQLDEEALTGMGLVPFKPLRKPSWAKSKGRPPMAYRVPELLDVEAADRVLFEILDRQYGPRQADGSLERPRFCREIPVSFSDLPF